MSKKNDFSNDFSLFKTKSIKTKIEMSKGIIDKIKVIRNIIDTLESKTSTLIWNYPRYSEILIDL